MSFVFNFLLFTIIEIASDNFSKNTKLIFSLLFVNMF